MGYEVMSTDRIIRFVVGQSMGLREGWDGVLVYLYLSWDGSICSGSCGSSSLFFAVVATTTKSGVGKIGYLRVLG